MLHQSAIEGYFAQQEGLLVEAVSRLVRIDSTWAPPSPASPLAPARQPLWRPSSPWPRNGAFRGRTAPAMWAP